MTRPIPDRPPERALAAWTPAAARRAVLTGLARTLALVAATLAFGLGWAGAERLLAGPGAGPGAYDREAVSEPERPEAEPPEPNLWLVDGFNVLHAGVLHGRDRAGWWKAETQLRLVERVARFEPAGAEVWVVFDAAHEHSERCQPPEALARVKLFFAPSADDWLVRLVRRDASPARLAVVTGDRQVQGRVRHAGARVFSPRAFLARRQPPAPASATPA